MIEMRLNGSIPEFRERAARRQVRNVVLLLMIFAVAGVPRSRAQGPQATVNGAPKSIRNQTGIELVWIPPGSFTMGSTDAEIQAAYDDMGVLDMAKGDLDALMRDDEDRADQLDAERFKAEEADRRSEVDSVVAAAAAD